MQTPYKFCILSGMPGYMPNHHSGALIAYTRRDFAEIVRSELEVLDYPANRFHDFNIRRMWRFIQNAGSGSSCHSSCEPHNGEQIEICGLTDDEFDAMEREQDV